jgi:hypothetical protein
MSLKKLNKRKEELESQLYDLPFVQHDPDKYYQEKLNIEFELARVQSIIQYEINLLPFKYTIWVACGIMAVGLAVAIIKASWK